MADLLRHEAAAACMFLFRLANHAGDISAQPCKQLQEEEAVETITHLEKDAHVNSGCKTVYCCHCTSMP